MKIAGKAQKGLALDIGAGQGRNSIFLAESGFKVEAIDSIKTGLNQLKDEARKRNLAIKTVYGNIKTFSPKKNKYSLIIAINSLHFMTFEETKKIIQKIYRALLPNGFFYIAVTSIKDPAYKRCKENLKAIQKNTFFVPMLSSIRKFYNRKELLMLLGDFKDAKISETEQRDTHDRPHFHYSIRAVCRK